MDNKKGIALVIAIIVLLGLSLMATAVMLTTQSEMKIGAAHKWYVKSMDVAQAGLNEVIKRMKLPETDANYIGDTSTPPNPDWTTVVLLTTIAPGSIGDTTFVKDAQIGSGIGTGETLYYTTSNYTTTEDKANALKIHYKHKGNQIYFYDQNHQTEMLGDPSLIGAYYPVIVAEVTGRFGTAKRKIKIEMTKQSFALNIPGGLAASNISLILKGNRDVGICGHNHIPGTPWGTAASDADPTDPDLCFYINAGKEVYHVPRPDGTPHPGDNPEVNSECGLAKCIPGIITRSLGIASKRRSDFDAYGNPDILVDPNYQTPDIWEVLGFSSEAEMNQKITWASAPTMYTDTADADTSTPQYVKITTTDATARVDTAGTNAANDDITLNVYTLPGGFAKGVLWLRVNGITPGGGGGSSNKSFHWKGLVYIDDTLVVAAQGGTGDFWVLGSVAVKGDMLPEKKGGGGKRGMQVLYSQKGIDNTLEEQIGHFIILNWREAK